MQNCIWCPLQHFLLYAKQRGCFVGWAVKHGNCSIYRFIYDTEKNIFMHLIFKQTDLKPFSIEKKTMKFEGQCLFYHVFRKIIFFETLLSQLSDFSVRAMSNYGSFEFKRKVMKYFF